MYKYTGLVYRAYIQALMNQTLRERREVGLLVGYSVARRTKLILTHARMPFHKLVYK